MILTGPLGRINCLELIKLSDGFSGGMGVHTTPSKYFCTPPQRFDPYKSASNKYNQAID